jgi:ketosteroid isomerase-like protein
VFSFSRFALLCSSSRCEDRAVAAPEDVIRRYVESTSVADGDAAAALTADDAVIELPDGGVLEGKEGARQFAAKHAEVDGRTQAVRLISLEPRTENRFVATLEMTSRETATDELLYSMQVGAVIQVRDGLSTRNQAFPSPEEAASSA